ncbi:hypothetical protein [Streptococcus parasuis]|uniref:hypothetical protein n=1 Tax=Streptococcus parasuis TaxID=1501662 RepID=UPI0028B0927E|nr:hypothetical protein [Streptococcus parasuis]
MKIAEKNEFYNYLSAAYNLPQEAFSEALREKYWRWQVSWIRRRTSISLLGISVVLLMQR